MGKTLKYGEFEFGAAKPRPTTQGYRDGGACMAKGGMKKSASKAKAPVKTAPRSIKREPEAMVKREVALLKKADAPKAVIKHEMREMEAPTEMKKGGMSKTDKKVKSVMKEFGKGELHSGSKEGPVVKNPKQAVAIGYSEARKAVKKADGGMIPGQSMSAQSRDPRDVEKERADSRVLQELSQKYAASEAVKKRQAMQAAANKAAVRPMNEGQAGRGLMTEAEREQMGQARRQNYEKGGSVAAKLKKHAEMPASKAHGPKAATRLAKGGVPTFSKVPKIR